jgi:hypothetical protein
LIRGHHQGQLRHRLSHEGHAERHRNLDGPIYFTSFADDTIGGDSNMDGDKAVPMPGDWPGLQASGSGTVNVGDYVDLRYIRLSHSGTLSGSEVWLGNHEHIIAADVTVAAGQTLTLQPGAVVKVAAGKMIRFNATSILSAEGTVAQPIYITSIKEIPWAGMPMATATPPSPRRRLDRLDFNGGTGTLEHVESVMPADGLGSWHDKAAAISLDNYSQVSFSRGVLHRPYYEGVIALGTSLITLSNSVIHGADRGVNAYSGNSHIRLINCTLYDNRIGIWGHSGPIDLFNTIVAESFEYGIDMSFDTLTIRYANIWSSTGTNYYRCTDVTGTNGNISANPLFKDTTNYNFRLNYRSPCIDAAEGTNAPDSDFAGAPRYSDPRTITKTGTPARTARMRYGRIRVCGNSGVRCGLMCTPSPRRLPSRRAPRPR